MGEGNGREQWGYLYPEMLTTRNYSTTTPYPVFASILNLLRSTDSSMTRLFGFAGIGQ